ncbi:MAG TPA: papain-like cysteine protease family protein [Bryobacteraceae bacterium]|nr:papain-like cysteine protease family protein [Bryobacteraceae bacterium]
MSGHGVACVVLVVAGCASVARAGTGPALAVPFFGQQKNGCGAASVAMVVHFWQHDAPGLQAETPERVYQRLYRGDDRGILLSDMRNYLEEAGLRAFTLRGNWADVERNVARGRPLIVGLKRRREGGMHFAVVVGVEGNQVWLNDPTRRKATRMRQEKFARQWELAGRWLLLAAPAAGN